jgi:hypothetical protein
MTPINREYRLNMWQWVIWRNEYDERKSVGRINTYVINKGYCCQGVVNEKDFEAII